MLFSVAAGVCRDLIAYTCELARERLNVASSISNKIDINMREVLQITNFNFNLKKNKKYKHLLRLMTQQTKRTQTTTKKKPADGVRNDKILCFIVAVKRCTICC